MSDPPPPPPPQPLPPEPMMLDETKSDGESADAALLSNSEFLTRHEVLRRRSDRAKRLAGIYRSHYWALMEELRAKYKDYYWMYGKSPYRDDGNVNGNGDGDGAVKEEDGNCTSRREGTGEEVRKCGVSGCKAKAMALTKFCHLHILSDSKQNLYTGCTYVVKRITVAIGFGDNIVDEGTGIKWVRIRLLKKCKQYIFLQFFLITCLFIFSGQAGPIFCGKPILRSTVPSLCLTHFQKAEKHVARALRKAGLNVTSPSKVAPKLHVVVAEYVRQIQTKRRAAQKAAMVKLEIKEEKTS
ncbi:hypothetical protein EZV62_024756 [Acer yangbiense]|uniref:KANL2-like probable zinc-finger domain-containing protein n=1 Tax=Acer yangbiense TaxID=1000413 RepID=A0A5C7GWD1_9ROSI|nr:hypothetical protein EZV62_024756 [Acer yangbiense]